MTSLLRGARGALLLAAVAGFCAAQNPPEGARPAQEPEPPKLEAAVPEAKALAAVDPNRFLLGAEDIIGVRVWRENELSGVHAIRPDGKITLPLIGEIVAAGLTPVKLGVVIADQLGKYLTSPQVSVDVRAVRSKRYYVTGEIFRPGAYPLVVPTRVFEAITLAGGFREFANKKKITIMRGKDRLKFNYNDVVKGKNLEQNILLESGDTIIVP